jgi:hypothetical protein
MAIPCSTSPASPYLIPTSVRGGQRWRDVSFSLPKQIITFMWPLAPRLLSRPPSHSSTSPVLRLASVHLVRRFVVAAHRVIYGMTLISGMGFRSSPLGHAKIPDVTPKKSIRPRTRDKVKNDEEHSRDSDKQTQSNQPSKSSSIDRCSVMDNLEKTPKASTLNRRRAGTPLGEIAVHLHLRSVSLWAPLMPLLFGLSPSSLERACDVTTQR